HPRGECGRVESNHHSRRRRGYSPLSPPVLSVCVFEGAADRVRTGTARITTSNAAVTPRPPRAGTTGLEPAAPPGSQIARVGFEPTSRAHEAREESRSSTARRKVWPAGVEPAVSGSRNRWGGRLPRSQT